MGGTTATAGMSAPSAGKGGSSGGNTPAGTKASVKIEPLAAMPTAGTSGGAAGSGTAGMTAMAGSGAAAGSGGSSSGAGAGGAGGKSGSGGSSASAGKGGSTASGGSGGRRSFFDEGEPNVYAAGSGGASGGSGGKGGSGGTSSGSAGAAAGSGGMSAAAGSGAAGAAAGSGAKAGSGGAAAPAGPISGTATFTATATGVDLTVMVSGCVAGKMYPIHIHTGTDCSDPMGHWDIPRGEGITSVMCAGNLGTTMYTRKFSDMKPWQIGDMSMADIVGHTLVIHDADTPTTKIACGKITKP